MMVDEEEELVASNQHGPARYDGQQANNNDTLSSNELSLRRWKIVYILCWASFIVLVIIGIVSIALGKIGNHAAVFAFGFSALLDGACAGVVVWRSHGMQNHGNDYTSPDNSKKHELVAEFLLGIIFIVVSIVILANSIIGLYTPFAQADIVLVIVSGIGGCVEIIFCIFKIYLGKVLHSSSVLADGINSLVCGLLGLSIIPSELIGAKTNNGSMDHILGIVVGAFLVMYGIVLIWFVFSDPVTRTWISIQFNRVFKKSSSTVNTSESLDAKD